MTWTDQLRQMHACDDAVEWAEQFDSLADAWEHCDRGDWMLWLTGRDCGIGQGNDRHVRLCWAVCLVWWELAYPFWYEYGEEQNDNRPIEVIERLEAFCLTRGIRRRLPEAAEAAEAAWAAREESLARMAEIVRDICEIPIIKGINDD